MVRHVRSTVNKQLKHDLLKGPGTSSPAADLVGHRARLVAPGRRFLSYDDLITLGIRFSRVHLRRLELTGAFPLHVKLGCGNDTQTSIAWLADEIESWIDVRIAARNQQGAA